MPDEGSITELIEGLQRGQDVAGAQQEIWNRYFHRVAALARQKLVGLRRVVEDEEDVAASVLNSLFVRIGDNRLPLLVDRNCLWPLLVKITACKAVNLRKKELAVKRGGGKLLGESALLHLPGGHANRYIDAIVSTDPTPAFAAEVADEYRRLLDALPDELLRLVAQRKVEAFTNQEIAQELDVTARTVERKLRLIRRLWEKELTDRESSLKFC
jgi:DNA-directed RNA polymerase specialized sigma24 family protein